MKRIKGLALAMAVVGGVALAPVVEAQVMGGGSSTSSGSGSYGADSDRGATEPSSDRASPSSTGPGWGENAERDGSGSADGASGGSGDAYGRKPAEAEPGSAIGGSQQDPERSADPGAFRGGKRSQLDTRDTSK